MITKQVLIKLLREAYDVIQKRTSWHPVWHESMGRRWGCSNYKTRPCDFCVVSSKIEDVLEKV